MDIDLIEKKIRELQILLGQGGLPAHAALTGSAAHGAVSAPTPSQLMTRDDAGRSQVVAPSVAADIARKDTVDAVQTNLTNHAALTGSAAHGAVSAPTPSQLMTRDDAGRSQVVAPSVAADIARKDTVDAVQTNLTNHAALTNPHSAVATPTADRLVLRDGAGRAQVVAPSVAADIATKAYVDGLAGISILYIEDQKPAITPGGTSVAGVWTQRDLNTVVTNSISGASLSSNRITLPAGTYFVEASAPVFRASSHKLKLYNYSDSSDIILGTSEQSGSAGDYAQTRSFVKGVFTLAAQKVVELRHCVVAGFATTGFGNASGFSVIEVYSQIEIRKVA